MSQKWFLQKRIILPALVLFPPLGIPLVLFSSSEPKRTIFGIVSIGLIAIAALSYQPTPLKESQQSYQSLNQVHTTAVRRSSLQFQVGSHH
ncbi:MAG TPA: hypothetical protein DCE56_42570 [Cyanobacteria bacterium UBA8553]|nr:hypothetical protein [Cyanobacteria bacterium UBA8553]HAJ62380.1 hypothetical protein [Cyanobacteria bacterium UBA8543]